MNETIPTKNHPAPGVIHCHHPTHGFSTPRSAIVADVLHPTALSESLRPVLRPDRIPSVFTLRMPEVFGLDSKLAAIGHVKVFG